MAHDFCIRNIKKEGSKAYFFGFANGLMYHAFGDKHHYAGVSGDNGKELKTKFQVEKALDWAIAQFDTMGYPDPYRLNDIKRFRKEMVNDSFEDMYEVWYG